MSRIQDKFLELKAKNQKAFIAYAMAGYPNEREAMCIVRGLIQGGADILELGLPFSDPLADGPAIQNASFHALQNRMNLDRFVNLVKKIRKESNIPLVLMTYANLLYSHGYDKFIKVIKNAGIDGIILPDMSVEEAQPYLDAVHKNEMDAIFLISPNTSAERTRMISNASSGFVYLVSVYGTTGGQQQFQKYTFDAIRAASKTLDGRIPLAVGFGVSNAEQARFILQAGADAIVVASAFLRLVDKTPQSKIQSKVASFAMRLKKATISE